MKLGCAGDALAWMKNSKPAVVFASLSILKIGTKLGIKLVTFKKL